MCGILGAINIEINKELLDTISHRGPDSSGLEKEAINNHEVYLGHRRLSIVDLTEAGSQPMNSLSENSSIIFNGEIYNHLELRKDLENVTFRGHSDTETIIEYIEKNGIDFVKNFNGIFAFAYLDKKNNKLYLVRDPFGVKPLYYYHNSNKILFSSEIRPIKKSFDAILDKNNLATLLKLRYNPSPNTLHNNIYKLKPGHILTVDLNTDKLVVNEKSFVSEIPSTQKINFNEAVSLYGKNITEAVNRQLMSDVEIGILLSGGVDSALVAGIAQKLSRKKLKAFTVGFEDVYEEDEIADAKETADILGLEHISVKINFNDFLKVFEETSRIVEEPLATTSVIPMYYLAKLASKYVKVVLTGQGADEPLGGYQKYQGELLSQKIPAVVFDIGQKLTNILNIKNEKIIRAVNSLGEKDDVMRFLNVYSIFSSQEIFKLINIKEQKSFDQINYFYQLLNCKKKKNSVERMMAIDTRMNLSDDLLLYTDKITMNYSLECRVPLLDVELVKFLESLPTNYKVKRGQSKIIHKQYAKQILPPQIINRKKKGFQSPTRIWFKKYSNQIEDLLLENKSVFSEIFNLDEVRKIIVQHQKGYNREKQIFLLLGIYYWLKAN